MRVCVCPCALPRAGRAGGIDRRLIAGRDPLLSRIASPTPLFSVPGCPPPARPCLPGGQEAVGLTSRTGGPGPSTHVEPRRLPTAIPRCGPASTSAPKHGASGPRFPSRPTDPPRPAGLGQVGRPAFSFLADPELSKTWELALSDGTSSWAGKKGWGLPPPPGPGPGIPEKDSYYFESNSFLLPAAPAFKPALSVSPVPLSQGPSSPGV